MSPEPVPLLRGGHSTVYELIRFLSSPRPYLVTPSLSVGISYLVPVSTPAVDLLMAVYHHHTNLSLPPPKPPIPGPTHARFSIDTRRCLHDWARPSSEQSHLCQLADESSGVASLLVESHPYYYHYFYLPAVRDRNGSLQFC